MTHDELVKRGAHWLEFSQGCSVVVRELGNTHEQPDVIGWSGWGSVLIEAKVTLQDFRKDFRKTFRRPEMEDTGMGRRRYYIVPEELKGQVSDLIPEKWGFLVCGERRIFKVKESESFENNWRNEMLLLNSIIRRISVNPQPLPDTTVRNYSNFQVGIEKIFVEAL